MTHIFHRYRQHILDAIAQLQSQQQLPEHVNFEAITTEPPREESHGDIATNAAMVLARQVKKNPQELAQALAAILKTVPDVTAVNVAGAGFINLTLRPDVFWMHIPAILSLDTEYGRSTIGGGKKINIEYVSANPTGPLHVGHARGAVVGDALANVMQKAGFDVTREYYINDAGAQVDKVAESAYLRYQEACGITLEAIPEGLYPGEYMKIAGEAIKKEYGTALLEANRQEWLPKCKDIALHAMLTLIKEDLSELGIYHDTYTSEAALHAHKKIEEAIDTLVAHGLIYRGILEPPKGKKPEEWEAREQLLFRATAHGDDVDRPVQKSDGTYTYFAGDLALANDKIRRGFSTQILVLGADHGGYVKRLQAAVSALSDKQASCDVLLCQLVHLFQNGEPFKMSKRAGTFVTVRDVLDTVGKDILRFIMLTRKSDMVMDFDLEKVKEQSKDNPVFYVQYAHARVYSLLRLAQSEHPDAIADSLAPSEEILALLVHPAELTLVKKLAQWTRIVEQAAIAREPHRIAFYLQELAADFHAVWNLGHKSVENRFIVKDAVALTSARLALARCIAIVIASGLAICGVTPLKEL